MKCRYLFLLVVFVACAYQCFSSDVLIKNVLVYDGSGKKASKSDVRITGNRIVAVGKHLKAGKGETIRDEHGLALAPGFIDMHSHGDSGIFDDLDAENVTRQGVTTIFVGQDGGSNYPLADFYSRLEKNPPALNIASMVGHATVRQQVMGKDLYRASTPEELAKMKEMLGRELQAGAFGLSSGLEYEDGHFATTEEMIELSKVAAAAGGFYISHVRDEADKVFQSYDEIIRIGREARIPVEISHIKLGATQVWHMAKDRMPEVFEAARKQNVDLKADVYPYLYWHSTIRVLVTDRDYFNPETVAKALATTGGPDAVRLVRYKPEPALAGKTLSEIAKSWGVTPVDAYMRIVKATESEINGGEEQEEIIGTSMTEDDLMWFIKNPRIMFCSDGGLHGAHPRGAGSFPRVLGRYVREQHVATLEDVIHRMTQLPAEQLGLKDRGRIAPGYIADLVIFDPAAVNDTATIEHPEAPPVGIPDVMVSGEWVVATGKVTGARPGKVLRHEQHPE
jgi:N-acyl-D-amino-acid deacylase